MKYVVKKEFVKINETSGTIQNVSRINPVEVSNQAVNNTDVFFSPQKLFSFSGTAFENIF